MRATRRIRAHAGSFLLLAVLTLTAAVAVAVVPRLTRAMATTDYVSTSPTSRRGRQLVLQQAGFRGFHAVGGSVLRRPGGDAPARAGPLPSYARRCRRAGRLVDELVPPWPAGRVGHRADARLPGRDRRRREAAELVDSVAAATAPPLGSHRGPERAALQPARPDPLSRPSPSARPARRQRTARSQRGRAGDRGGHLHATTPTTDWQIGDPSHRIDDRPSLAAPPARRSIEACRGSVRECATNCAVERADAADSTLSSRIEQLRRQTAGELDLTEGVDLSLRQFAKVTGPRRSARDHRRRGGRRAGRSGRPCGGLRRRAPSGEYGVARGRGASVESAAPARREALVVAPTALLGEDRPAPARAAPPATPHPSPVLAVGADAAAAIFELGLAPRHRRPRRAVPAPGSTARSLPRRRCCWSRDGDVTAAARGLDTGAGVDPLLAAVPVLLAAAAALLVLRLYPLPMRRPARSRPPPRRGRVPGARPGRPGAGHRAAGSGGRRRRHQHLLCRPRHRHHRRPGPRRPPAGPGRHPDHRRPVRPRHRRPARRPARDHRGGPAHQPHRPARVRRRCARRTRHHRRADPRRRRVRPGQWRCRRSAWRAAGTAPRGTAGAGTGVGVARRGSRRGHSGRGGPAGGPPADRGRGGARRVPPARPGGGAFPRAAVGGGGQRHPRTDGPHRIPALGRGGRPGCPGPGRRRGAATLSGQPADPRWRTHLPDAGDDPGRRSTPGSPPPASTRWCSSPSSPAPSAGRCSL